MPTSKALWSRYGRTASWAVVSMFILPVTGIALTFFGITLHHPIQRFMLTVLLPIQAVIVLVTVIIMAFLDYRQDIAEIERDCDL